MKKIINVVAVVVIIAAGLYLWRGTSQAPGSRDQDNLPEQPSVSLEFIFGDGRNIKTTYDYPAPASYSLFTITKEAANKEGWAFLWEDYGEMGILVTQIEQVKNGADNKYWQYYVNGNMPQIGASNYYPKDKDKIKWVFQESEY